MPVPITSSCDQDLEDIEDIFQQDDLTPADRMNNRSHVTSYVRRMDVVNGNDEKPHADSIIPGTQTIYIKTWGCTHNNSDSEYMAGQLASYGYNVTTTDSLHADLWLLNSCTVKNPAEDGFKNDIKKAHQLGKYVVVAGCVPQGQPRGEYIKGLSVIGVQQIDRVVEVVEETLKGHTVRLLGQKKQGGRKIGGANLNLPKVRKNPLIEIIAINTGCLNQCTYCKTKHARGELGSYPPEEIIARAKQSFQEGVVEIWLTSEDTGAYGKDIGVTLPELLYQLVEVIPVGCMMRVGMTNPPYIQEYLKDMAKILNHPRVYSFLHIPVQSASNEVLNDMKREYTIEDFKHTVDFLKEKVPRLTVATDLICGFPTETPEDFEKSCDLVREYQFPSLFINQFFPRPGTPAAKMKRVPTDEVKDRTKQVSAIFQSYFPYEHELGEKQMILITEEAKDKIHFVGHNKSYDQVLIKGDNGLMGKMVEVEIYETGKHFVKGRLVENSEVISPGLSEPLPKGVVSGAPEITKEVVLDVSQPLPNSVWKTILHMGLFVLIVAIVLDICRLFFMISKSNMT
ncbi:threonylcarbamoyladenosine tRNA methylthiotransferase-like [Hydractinia symbiolongicarpus]|uniref:threonylcarbamoyladenosine tRNA methylthiotransferase-like n=1 Tax=Hydractinia symbiolongicarpus TaxID=13093 RepID=UPI00254FF197|nr:threonylcarbamoyladenosine tRNA methylthiotransferase-like [Hydractinia symbiolongicarpus]